MLAEIAVIPSAPLLVPELAGPGAVDTEPVRAAAIAAGTSLAAAASRWIAVGLGASGRGRNCASTGDFGGYGVPVPVSLPHEQRDTGDRCRPMPLSMLIAGWLGGRTLPAPREIAPVLADPERVAGRNYLFGASTAMGAMGFPEPLGLLVVADGANALSPSSPGGGERASAWAVQHRIDAALAAADSASLAGLDPAACEPEGVHTLPVWQMLAGVLREWRPAEVEIRYSAAPFGVGYTVATMRAGGRER